VIGFCTVRRLALSGARVYVGARSPKKLQLPSTNIKTEFPEADLHFLQMNLMDVSTVVNVAKIFNEKETRLNDLENTAGIMETQFARSATDGFKAQ
jgi:NADP-dependent 3-hydroxy acid dehydrogenase YdfG